MALLFWQWSCLAAITAQPSRLAEPLLTMGHHAYRYSLYLEHADGALRLVSRSANSTIARAVPDGDRRRADIQVTFAPQSGRLTVTVNGVEFLVHDIGTLVTAPAEIAIGDRCHFMKPPSLLVSGE